MAQNERRRADGYHDSFEQVCRLSRPAAAQGMTKPMARREYYNDPDAPAPNSLVVATSAGITDDNGRILLQRRADSGNWALPGGGMDISESLTDSVIREVKEEAGFDIEVTGLVGTYTDPRHIIAYTDGEVRRQFNICYTARITSGQLTMSDVFIRA